MSALALHGPIPLHHAVRPHDTKFGAFAEEADQSLAKQAILCQEEHVKNLAHTRLGPRIASVSLNAARSNDRNKVRSPFLRRDRSPGQTDPQRLESDVGSEREGGRNTPTTRVERLAFQDETTE